MLAIEVDGDYHEIEDVKIKDRQRQEQIESLGINFIRFKDDTIKHDIQSALIAIEEYIDKYEKHSPNPS